MIDLLGGERLSAAAESVVRFARRVADAVAEEDFQQYCAKIGRRPNGLRRNLCFYQLGEERL